VAKGAKGKIEILGLGQQVVAHGIHPSGSPLTWQNGRGPDAVPLDQIPVVSEEQITAFLEPCAALLDATPTSRDLHTQGHYFQSNAVGATAVPKISAKFESMPPDNNLGAGIEPTSSWFHGLAPQGKSEVVQACLNALDNRTSDPREVWLQVLFAVADAERLGCPNAHQLALDWSRRGRSWASEADFERAWSSYKDKPGGTTVGSLLAKARDAGLDLSRWRDPVLAQLQVPIAPTNGSPSASVRHRALSTSALPLIPPKRKWLHGTDVVRSSVSLMVAPGARGKTSWLITLALACASNRPLLGAHVFGGPLRVLLISAEDATNELALRLRASMKHHGLTDADVVGLHVIGADGWGISLLSSSASGPVLNKAGWDELNAELDRLEPDLLIRVFRKSGG
jgi:AAA domain/Primase C terminal 2 (PriCT-2)